MLLGLGPAGIQQGDLFAQAPSDSRARLLAVLDEANQRMGKGTLRFAAEGIAQPWKMRRDKVTPNYISDWDELPLVN